ncbi:MAG: metallophosphoesterase [Gemmataceae bacterium]
MTYNADMRIAITADLHWGHGERGSRAALALRDFLLAHPPDLLLLGGDQGTADNFNGCLDLFANLSCPKALVPGNHDIWVEDGDARGDSLHVYNSHLPAVCKEHGFHYLDHGPLVRVDAGLAIVGSINWYDYSWSLDKLKAATPDWDYRLRTMQFTRGRHNDRRFVQWPLDDVGFTRRVVGAFAQHLETALAQAEHALVLTHHPAFYGLNFPRDTDGPLSLDALLWDAFSGNRDMEDLLTRHAERIAAAFCGHTHRQRENHLGPIAGYNIGGDYHFKRLLLYGWPGGAVEAHVFGQS